MPNTEILELKKEFRAQYDIMPGLSETKANLAIAIALLCLAESVSKKEEG